MMEAVINAGGKGTRMGQCGIEKPMQIIGGKPVVQRVVDAISASKHISRVLVSVSSNTLETERFLKDLGVETIRTSGDDFMMDLRHSFSVLRGDYVMTCPSDMPLLTTPVVDECAGKFKPEMQSMVVMVSAELVRKLGITPSYACAVHGREYVLSGLSFMDREATIRGDYLREYRMLTEYRELAVNVNTPGELQAAREMCSLL